MEEGSSVEMILKTCYQVLELSMKLHHPTAHNLTE